MAGAMAGVGPLALKANTVALRRHVDGGSDGWCGTVGAQGEDDRVATPCGWQERWPGVGPLALKANTVALRRHVDGGSDGRCGTVGAQGEDDRVATPCRWQERWPVWDRWRSRRRRSRCDAMWMAGAMA